MECLTQVGRSGKLNMSNLNTYLAAAMRSSNGQVRAQDEAGKVFSLRKWSAAMPPGVSRQRDDGDSDKS